MEKLIYKVSLVIINSFSSSSSFEILFLIKQSSHNFLLLFKICVSLTD